MSIQINEQALDVLIPQYYANKTELDDYKKIVDKENKQIKELMKFENIDEKVVNGYVAKYIVQKRENINEDALIKILSEFESTESLGLIKTRPYVDFDAIEDAIYKGKIPEEILLKMDSVKEVKEVVTLKVTKTKEKK